MAAWTVYEGPRAVATLSSAEQAEAWMKRRVRPMYAPFRLRCHRMTCRRWYNRPDVIDLTLGWAGYCSECTLRLIEVCRVRYGRAPLLATEFFCPHCFEMRGHPGDRCPQEADGRTRIMCKPCRSAQLAKRQQRKREQGIRAA